MDEQEKRAVRGLIVRALLAGTFGMIAGAAAIHIMNLLGGRLLSYAAVIWVPWVVVVILFLPMAYRMGRDTGNDTGD